MHLAIHLSQYPAVAQALLDAGADVNARNYDGSTPLGLARVMDNQPAVWRLREAGGTR